MSSENERKDYITDYLPGNYGYMKNDRKQYGKLPDTKDSNMKLVEGDKLHIWSRSAYIKQQLNTKETDYDGWTTVSRRKLVENRQMNPCPFELNNEGICEYRFEELHKKHFYHFSKLVHGHPLKKNCKVVCRYNLHNQNKGHICWERNNALHRRVFTH
jgi:hypothetical protein